ncbi:site-2 protease family protein [Kocuria palustris]|uniref:site-2 protease family protein n=1 Tax=Kocuria palustris TaxID=71999 RepID=UPI0011A38E83|nr:site-2 protease family protein [Kocuria palustris]
MRGPVRPASEAAAAHPAGRRPAPRGSLPLGRIGGMPVHLQASWLVIGALVVVLYGPVLRRSMPELGAWAYLVALGFCVLLALSVLLHELAHAGTARLFGWPVDRIVLSIMGGHTSFGRTRPGWGASTVVSLVGPLVNLGIAGLGFAALPLIAGGADALGGRILWMLVSLSAAANLLIGVFNLLPGLPLDGGRVLEGLVWGLTGRERTGIAAAAWAGRLCAVVLVTAVLLLGLWRSPLTLVITGFLVWMLVAGAAQGLRRARAAAAMEGTSAAGLGSPAVGIPAALSLGDVERTAAQLEPGTSVVGLDEQGRAVGVLDGSRLRAIPEAERARSPLSRALLPVAPAAVLPESLGGHDLLETAARADSPVMVVVDADGAVTGTLSAASINGLLARAGLIRADGTPR